LAFFLENQLAFRPAKIVILSASSRFTALSLVFWHVLLGGV
jgi:hypothetical protein